MKQVIVVVVALAALLAIAWVLVRKQRTINLRKRFGLETTVPWGGAGLKRL